MTVLPSGDMSSGFAKFGESSAMPLRVIALEVSIDEFGTLPGGPECGKKFRNEN